jgi:putative membrane protein
MIIREKQNWFRLLFVWKESVLPEILPRLLVLFMLSCLVFYYHGTFWHYKIPLNAAPFTLIGVALAIFIGFYNNASYDRFWEGRKLWGSLLNDCRSLMRQATTLSGYAPQSQDLKYFLHVLISLVYALKHQLRGTDATEDMERLLATPLKQTIREVNFKPVILMQELGKWVQKTKTEGKIDSITASAFDNNLNNLSNIIGGCERIVSTPIPFTYKVLLHRTVYLYCLLLPFGLVDSIGWMTPIMVVFISYTFMAFDAIVNEIEEPFGNAPNDLALNAMCKIIENTLREMAGENVENELESKSYIID